MACQIKSLAAQTKATACYRDHTHGFSLVEVLIAMTIMSLVLVGCLSSYLCIAKGMSISLAHGKESSNIHYAMERILRDVRPISEVHQTNNDQFEFSTIDMEGNSERLKLYYDSTRNELIEENLTLGSSRSLLSGVRSVQFSYFDRFGAATSTQIDINAVQLELLTTLTVTSGSKDMSTKTAVITFRNRTL